MRTLWLLSSILLVPAVASAQPSREQVLEDLSCLVGSWTGEGTVEADGETHAVRFQYTCRSASAGAAVSCRLVVTGLGDAAYESSDLWGHDPGTGAVHWFTVTNAGETHDHRGRIGRDSFVGTYVGRRDGRPMRENVRLQFHGRDRFDIRSVVFVNRERVEAVTVTASRQAPRHAQTDGR